jgi:phosphate transport system protein
MAVAIRSLLDRELTELNDDTIRLASMVDEAIGHSMEALNKRNVALAQQVITQDEKLNLLRYQIEQNALRTLATQQPTAGDLRFIIATLHIVGELERMGDHAVGIARLVNQLEEEPALDSLHQLPKMAKRARLMLQECLDAYVARSADMAHTIIKQDDKLDKQYHKLFRQTLEEMRDDEYIHRATSLLWAGHNLERIGDRATNIAERVIFMTTGVYVEVDLQTP